MSLWDIVWKRNRVLVNIFADFQGRAVALIFFFTIMVPFGIGVRLLGDPLHRKAPIQWRPREAVGKTLEEARRQG